MLLWVICSSSLTRSIIHISRSYLIFKNIWCCSGVPDSFQKHNPSCLASLLLFVVYKAGCNRSTDLILVFQALLKNIQSNIIVILTALEIILFQKNMQRRNSKCLKKMSFILMMINNIFFVVIIILIIILYNKIPNLYFIQNESNKWFIRYKRTFLNISHLKGSIVVFNGLCVC